MRLKSITGLKTCEIPCIFPVIREFEGGDQFDMGCNHHAVRCEPAFPGLRRNARNLRAFWRVQIPGARSLRQTEVAIAWILAPSLWARQTRSWRTRAELDVKNDRIKDSKRQTEHRVLAGPLSRGVAQTSHADAVRQSPFDGTLHELGREECERDRHIDLSNGTFFACSDLIHTGDGAGNDLIEPTPTARDGCDKVWRGSRRGSDGATRRPAP
jgi:hypothetical protein